MEYKDTIAEIKAIDDKGEGILRFIKFHQEDKDSDITLPGFIGRQEAILIPAHNWKSDYPPLGRGVSYEADGATNFSFRLNLDDPRARQWMSWLKMDRAAERPLQQISYGFSVHEEGQERSVKDGRPIRYLKPRADGSPGAKLHEVSFVTVGSGTDTGVLDIKAVKAATRLWPGMEVSPMGVREQVSDAVASLRAGLRQLHLMNRLLEREPPSTKQVRMIEYTAAGLDDLAVAQESLEQALDALRRDPSAPMLEPPVPLIRALPEPLAPVAPPVETPLTADSTEEPMEKGGTRPIQEHLAEVLQSVEDATQRLEEVKRLRETPSERYPHGRPMSAERLSNIDTLIARLSRLKAEGTAVVEPTVVQDAQQQELQAMSERFKQLGVAI